VTGRQDPEMDRLWQEFHELVNVPSAELHAWLMTEAADENGAVDDSSGPPGPPETRRVLAVLGKRKVDLTEDDLDAMRQTIESIRLLLSARPAVDVEDEQWRHDLLDLGHDPLVDAR
jgi:Protein of unknown function (DUF3140)